MSTETNEPKYITKTEAYQKLGISIQKLTSVMETLKIETIVSNRDNRVQLIEEGDFEKIKKYLSR